MPNHFTLTFSFAVKGAMYHVAIATVIFSHVKMYHVAIATVIFTHVKITCYFHM